MKVLYGQNGPLAVARGLSDCHGFETSQILPLPKNPADSRGRATMTKRQIRRLIRREIDAQGRASIRILAPREMVLPARIADPMRLAEARFERLLDDHRDLVAAHIRKAGE